VSSPPKRRALVVLFLLYFAQGLPFGFQKELASFLRHAGVSLERIGFSRALSAPWILKALWAPLVDRFGSDRFGRRKSWLVPMQLLLALTCVVAALFPPERGLAPLLALILLLNLFAATQDIAVDGLAVDLLQGQDLGPANIAQVVGYKAGMLFAAGLLVPLRPRIGWDGILYALGGILLLWAIGLLFFREPAAAAKVAEKRRSLRAVVDEVLRSLRAPGATWLVLFVASYKVGEEMADAMLRPFLIDAGFSVAQLARWIGSYGMVASLAGSLFGGLLALRLPLLAAVAVCSVLRAGSVSGEWYLALLGKPGATAVILATLAEHFCGGALTTAMFAFMMSRVNKAVGGTHFTLLACVEVLGKMPPSLLSGMLAQRLGYSWLFGIATALSFLFLLLLLPLHRSLAAAAERRPDDAT
jgi:MFS family permease